MKKTLFILFAALMSFVSMSAQEQRPVDNNVIQLASVDDEATFTFNADVHGFTFQAIEDGIIEFHVGWSSVMIYLTDRAFNESTKTMLSKQSDDNGNFYFTEVEKGKTYYFSTSVLTDPTEIKVMYGTGDPGISIDANYEDNSLYSITGRDLELTVDRQVNVGKYLVIYGEENTEEVIPTDYIAANYTTAYYITVMLGGLMDYMMDGGKITYGDKFTIRLEGITDASDDRTDWARVENTVFNDRIGISLNVSKAQNVSVRIYNTAGASVFGRDYSVSGNGRIDVAGLGNLRDGIYIMRLEAADGRFVQKLIKR